MIKLRSGNTYLDVVDDGSLQITKSVQDVEDFTARTSSYSQNFTLPFTPTNNTFFAHFYNVSSKPESSLFDATKREPISIEDEGMIVMEGYMQLLEADPTSRTYEVVCFDDPLELKNAIENKTLRDITALEDLTHEFILSNILLSWDGDLLDGVVKYPVVNYGDEQKKSNEIYDNTLRPWVSVKWLFDNILKQAGFSYVSDFLDSNVRFTKMYYSWANTGLVTDNEDYAFRAKFDSDTDVFTFGTLVLRKLNYDASAGVIGGTGIPTINQPAATPPFDNANFKFTPISSGKHDMRISVTLKTTVASNTTRFPSKITVLIVNDIAPVSLASPAIADGAATLSVENFASTSAFETKTFVFDLPQVQLRGGQSYTVHFVNEGGSFTIETSNSFWEMLSPPQAQPGFDVLMNENAPDVNQLDFVRGVINHFNLQVESISNNDRVLNIEPYNEYIDSGNVIDWSGKVDLSQGISIRPATELQKKNVSFNFDDDDVFYTKGRDLGSFSFESDNDFTEGEEKLTLPYGAPPTYIIRSFVSGLMTDIPTYQLLSIDDGVMQPVTFTPRVAYLNTYTVGFVQFPSTPINPLILFNSITGTTTVRTSGLFAHNVLKIGDDLFDLTFNRTKNYGESAGLEVPADDDAYTVFWQRYVNEIYNNEAKVVTADFMLTPSDILTFNFNDRIFYKDTFYRVLEIQNYAVGQRQPTTVKMVSLVGEAASPWNDCDGIILTFSSDGSVSFSGTDTEACCRRYGYRFINGTCYWRPRSGWTGAPIMPPPPQTTLPGAGQPVTGACCYNDGETDTCDIMTESQCTLVGGNWLGQGSDCTQCSPGLTPTPFVPE